jgi:mannosyltransferase OCH1-like enzyme
VFKNGLKRTQAQCRVQNIEHKLWLEDECLELLEQYPTYKQLYEDFCQPIMRLDFIRLLILHTHGGIYIDLDAYPIRGLNQCFERPVMFVHWNTPNNKIPYNAIMGCEQHSKVFMRIIEHCKESYYIKKAMPIYKQWTGRLVYQTTGHHMINRVLKELKVAPENILNIMWIESKGKTIKAPKGQALFKDQNASVWY